MRAYKCSICAGTLIPMGDGQTGKCDYCGNYSPLLSDNSETVLNYMNRATDYRIACDYDRAMQIYDEVLKLASNDPEAHWGMLLCKYGVEYVKDAATTAYSAEKLTLHRLSTVSVFDDADYQAAIRYATPSARATYEERAKEINKVLQEALIEVRTAEPYDIFLSYKEKDDVSKIRTDDSYFAHDLYNELTGKGYKVFFAPKSLSAGVFESKIYAALVSAKTMLVIGSKESYFNAVWVKNEWKRFLEMKKRGENKQIIPIFRNASPQIIPVELAGENALDANTIDFLPRLLEMLAEQKKTDTATKAGPSASYGVSELERLLQNAETFLNLKKTDTAKELYQKITYEYPNDYRGWWGLIVCETDFFSKPSNNIEEINKWYTYAKQLAGEKDFLDYQNAYHSYLSIQAAYETEKEKERFNDQLNGIDQSIKRLEEKMANDSELIRSGRAKTSDDILKERNKCKKEGKVLAIVSAVVVATTLTLLIIDIIQEKVIAFFVTLIIGGIVAIFFIVNSGSMIMNAKAYRAQAKAVAHSEKKIAAYEAKKEPIYAYLNLDDSRIADLLCYDLCKEVGISHSCDTEADALRKAAEKMLVE